MISKKRYLGTNTKMYKTIAQTVSFLTDLARRTSDVDREQTEIFVIPSYTALDAARRCVSANAITLGAQNMGWMDEGPLTGEISPLMLKEVGVEIIEIGHSERRHVLLETDEMENWKVLCAVGHCFRVLLCVGETAEQKQIGLSDKILRLQLRTDLCGVTPEQADQIMIGYEPVWAIGASGIPATKEYCAEMHTVIRAVLAEMFGEEIASAIPILYGGSVNNENAVGFIHQKNVDGLFIGRSAWNAENFAKIIHDVL